MKRKISRYFPVFLNVRRKKCVVVGGGKVACRKVRMLVDCGANVTVVSPILHSGLVRLSKAGIIGTIERDYKSGDLKGAFVVIAATDAKETNHRVAKEAGRVRAIVNVVDDPEPSDFIVPSFFRRGNLSVAVSTAGRSPALARKIRTRLEENLGEEYRSLVALMDDVRSSLRQQRITVSAEDWQRALDLDLLARLLRTGHEEKAKAVLMEKLKNQMTKTKTGSKKH